MKEITLDCLSRWTHGTGLVALAALAWAVLVPGGVLWTGVLAAGLIGFAVATAVFVRRRSIPSLGQVIASAGAETVLEPAHGGTKSGTGLRPRGE